MSKGNKKTYLTERDDPPKNLSQNLSAVSKGNKKTNKKKRKATSGAKSPPSADDNEKMPPHANNKEVGLSDEVVSEHLTNTDGAKQTSNDTPGIPPTPKKEEQTLKEAWGIVEQKNHTATCVVNNTMWP